MIIDRFPDQVDPRFWLIARDVYLGQPVDRAKAALALYNLVGYGIGLTLGQPSPMSAGEEMSSVEVVTALETLGYPDSPSPMQANGELIKKLLPILLRLLIGL